MRAYFFGNMYLSSIQQGIQAAHTLSDMFVKYKDYTHKDWYLHKWAMSHKTMILLNGGYAENLKELINFFSEPGWFMGNEIRNETSKNPYPWAYFEEGQDSLNSSLTCVGIILPDTIYETAAELRTTGKLPLSSSYLSNWEIEMIERLNTYGMAK